MAKLKMDLDPPSEAIHAGVIGLVMLVFILARVSTTRGFAAFRPGFNTRAVATWLAVSSLTLLVVFEAILAYVQYKQSMGAYFNTPPFEQVMSNNRDMTFNATNLYLPTRNLTIVDLADNPHWDVWERKEYMGFFITGKPIGLYSPSDLDLFKGLKILLKFSQSGLVACLLILNTYWCRHVEALVDEGDFMSAREKFLYYILAVVVYVLPISLTLALGYGVGDWRKADLATDITLFVLGFLTIITYVITVRRLQALNRDARNVDGEDTSVTLQLSYYVYCIYWLLASMVLILLMGILYVVEFLYPERNPVLAQAVSDLMSSLWSTVVILVYPSATFLLYPSVDVLTKPKNDPAPRFKRKDRRPVGDPKKFRESLYMTDAGRDSNSLAQGDSSILGLTNSSPPLPVVNPSSHTAGGGNSGGDGGDEMSQAEAGYQGRTSQDSSNSQAAQPTRYSFYGHHQHMESIAAVVSGMRAIEEAGTNGSTAQEQQRQQHQQKTQSPATEHPRPASPTPQSTQTERGTTNVVPTYIVDKDEQEAMSRWLAQYDDVDRAGFIAGLEMSAPNRPRRSQHVQQDTVAEKQAQPDAQEVQKQPPTPGRARASMERRPSNTKPSTSAASNPQPLVGILKTRRSSAGNTPPPGVERKTSNKRMGATAAAGAGATTTASHPSTESPPPLPNHLPPMAFWDQRRDGTITKPSLPAPPPMGALLFTPTDPFYQQPQQQQQQQQQQQLPITSSLQHTQDTDSQSRNDTPKRRRSNITTRVDAQAVAMAQHQQPIPPSNTTVSHRFLSKPGSFDEHRRQLHPAASGFLNDDPYPSAGTVLQAADQGAPRNSSDSDSRRSSLERDPPSTTSTSKKYKAPPPPLPILMTMNLNYDPTSPSPGSSKKSTPVTPPGVRPKRSEEGVMEPHILEIAEKIYQEQTSYGFPSPSPLSSLSPHPFHRSASSPSTLGTQTMAPSSSTGPGYIALSSIAQQHQHQPLPPLPLAPTAANATTQPQLQSSRDQRPPPFRERELSFEEKVAAFVARSKAMNEALAAQKAAAQSQAQTQTQTAVAGPSAAVSVGSSSLPPSAGRTARAHSVPTGGRVGNTVVRDGGVAGSAMPASTLESKAESSVSMIAPVAPTSHTHNFSGVPPDSPQSSRHPIASPAGSTTGAGRGASIQDPSVPPSPPSPPSTASPTLTAGPTTLPRPLTPAWFENKTSFSSTADVYNHYQNVMRRAAEARSQHASAGAAAASAAAQSRPAGPTRGASSSSSTTITGAGMGTGALEQGPEVSPAPMAVIPDSVYDRYHEESKIGPLDTIPSPIQLSPLPSDSSPLTVPSDRRSSNDTVRAATATATQSSTSTAGALAHGSARPGAAATAHEDLLHRVGGGSGPHHALISRLDSTNIRDRHSFLTDSQSLYSNWTAELSDVTQTSGEVSVGAFIDRRGAGGGSVAGGSVARNSSHPDLRQQSSSTSTSSFGVKRGGSGSSGRGGGGHEHGDSSSTSSPSKRVSDVRKSHASSASGGTFGSHYGSSNLSYGSGPVLVSNSLSIARSSLVDDGNNSKRDTWKYNNTSAPLSVYGEEDEDTASTQAIHDPSERHPRTNSDDFYSDVGTQMPDHQRESSGELPTNVRAVPGRSQLHYQDHLVPTLMASPSNVQDSASEPYSLNSIYFKTTAEIQSGIQPPLDQLPPPPPQQQQQQHHEPSAESETLRSTSMSNNSDTQAMSRSSAPTSSASSARPSQEQQQQTSDDRAKSPSISSMQERTYSPRATPNSSLPPPPIPARSSSRSHQQQPGGSTARTTVAQSRATASQIQQQLPSVHVQEPRFSQLYYDSGDSMHTLRIERSQQQEQRRQQEDGDDNDEDLRSNPSSAPSSPTPIVSLATRFRPYQTTTGELENLERGTSPLFSAGHVSGSSSTSPSLIARSSLTSPAATTNARNSPNAQLAREILENARGALEDGHLYGGDDEREDNDDDGDQANWNRKRSQITSPQSNNVGSEYVW